MDIIILTDTSQLITKTTMVAFGAYRIANVYRDRGNKVAVINHLRWAFDYYYDSLISYLDRNIDKDTKFVGFSSTFLKLFNTIPHRRYYGKEFFVPDTDPDSGKEYDGEPLEKLVSLIEFLESKGVKIVLGGYGIESRRLWATGLFHHWVKETTYEIHNATPSFVIEDGFNENETLPIELSRGCRFKCNFCSFPLLGRKVTDQYVRSEDSIYAELMNNYELFGTTNYIVLCDTFNETTEKLRTVQRAMERTGLDFTFVAYLRIELIHKFPDQIKILRDMGIIGCHFGIESLHYPSAKAVGKGLSKARIVDTLQLCKDGWGPHTIVRGSFIIGLPHETIDTANAWCSELHQGQIPLDAFEFRALKLANPEKDTIFLSEFSRNSEKYGYVLEDDLSWTNEHMTYDIALEMEKHWSDVCFDDECCTLAPWSLTTLISLGYDWKMLSKLPKKELILGKFANEYRVKAKLMKKQYIERVLA